MSINTGALDNSARPVPFGVRVLALFSDHCIAFSTWVFHTLLILSDDSSSLNRGPVNSECACQTLHVKHHACCCGQCLTTIVALERVLDQGVHGVLHASCQPSMHERSHGFAVVICNVCVHHGSADSQHSVCSVCGSGVVGLAAAPHMPLPQRFFGMSSDSDIPKNVGIYGDWLLNFVSARTNKRHHHHPFTLVGELYGHGVTLSTQNCAQAGSQGPRPLPHMNLNVSERP